MKDDEFFVVETIIDKSEEPMDIVNISRSVYKVFIEHHIALYAKYKIDLSNRYGLKLFFIFF